MIITIFMSVVPAASAALILSLASFSYKWTDFVKNGEVAIFCVGLLSSSILLTAKELKSPFAHRQLFSFLGLAGVILAMACYGGLCVASAQATSTTQTSGTTTALNLALTLSLILYGYTIFLSAIVTFVDEVREDLPEQLITEAREAMQDNAGLREQFRGLSEDNDA
ncbi:hypothetical protein GC176_07300 [bacterium]|nr:hypothetical protein [bacterium]